MKRVVLIAAALFFAAAACTSRAQAQTTSAAITSAQALPNENDRFGLLQNQLTLRLRATTVEQRDYIALVVRLVRLNRIDPRLVVAVERYALKRNREFGFPYFERALRFETQKRGIPLVSFRDFVEQRGLESAF